MNKNSLQNLKPGDQIKLKKARQEAYSFASPLITFQGYQERPGYLVGFIKGTNQENEPGFFKISDFI